jgi:DNA-binding response OmpR family regulator
MKWRSWRGGVCDDARQCLGRAVGVAMTGTALTRQVNGAPGTRAAKPFVTDAPRFMLGDWLVDVHAHRLERGDESAALEPRLMAVLAELCRRPGDVISADALLDACWPGEALGDNPVHKVVAGLRRSLQD